MLYSKEFERAYEESRKLATRRDQAEYLFKSGVVLGYFGNCNVDKIIEELDKLSLRKSKTS